MKLLCVFVSLHPVYCGPNSNDVLTVEFIFNKIT